MKYSYEKKILIFVCIQMIILEAVLGGVSVVRYVMGEISMNDRLYNDKVYYCMQNMTDLFSAINAADDALNEAGVFEFTNNSYRLENAEKCELRYNEIRKKLDENPINKLYVKNSYVFGSNFNCENFYDGKKLGDRINGAVIKDSGLSSYIDLNFEMLFMFKKQNAHIEKKHISDEEYAELCALVDYFDGKYIYYTLKDTSYVFHEIDSDCITESLCADDNSGIIPYIAKRNFEVIYPEGVEFAESEAVRLPSGGMYLGIKRSRGVVDLKMVLIFLFIIAAACLLIAFSYFFTNRYAKRILKPYRCLNSIFKFLGDSLEKIELDNELFTGKKTIYQCVFFAIVTVVIIPALFSGILFSAVVSYNLKASEKAIFPFYENQTALNIKKATEQSLDMLDFFTVNDFSDTVQYEKFGRNGDSRLKVIGDYAVLDTAGSVVSSSEKLFLSTENKGVKDNIVKRITEDDADEFIFTADIDKRGTKNHVIGKRMFDENGEPMGYFCMFTGKSIFSGIETGNIDKFVVFDSFGMTVETSGYLTGYKDEADIYKKYGDKFLISRKKIVPYNFTAYSMRPKESSSGLPAVNMIFLLSLLLIDIIAAWRFSIVLVEPLSKILDDINGERKGVGVKEGKIYDEIGEIITAYNKMIGYVNRLIEEKAEMKVKQQRFLMLKNKAELNALQHRINPHFLYNTLEMVNMKFMENGNFEMSEVIVSLTRLFRYSLSNADAKATVKEELENVLNYLTIQEMRLKSSFETVTEIDDSVWQRPILKLLLQPIVENIFIHGFKNMNGKGVIKISIKDENGAIMVTVSDNGKGISPERLSEIRRIVELDEADECVALQNINKRIKLFYGDESSLSIDSEYGRGTVVRLCLKFFA